MNQNMNIYFNELNISSNNNNDNENIINVNKSQNFDNIYKQFDKISYLISKIEQIHFDIKKLFGINIENLLEEIQQNLNNINNKKYKNEETLKNMIDNIKLRIEEIENICFIFEENKNNFIDKNKMIEKEINILSEEFILIDEQKDINDNEWLNNNNIKAENLNAQTGNSSLFITKNISGKYDSRNLFKEGKEDLIENNTQKSKFLSKNWHQICYIYDDYDLHDIYFDVKAVGLPENEHTKVQQYYINTRSIIEIQKFSVDGKESEYIFNNNYIKFKLELSNLQSARIHLVYKKTKDLNKLSPAQKEIRKFFREEEYGLGKNLAGQIAKFSLILKGNFDIVRFDDYFFVRNKKNLSETEYTWGGVVPNEGKKTYILLSKIQANWLFHFSITFNSNNYIKDTILYSPIQFVGGNNEIIKINASSKQTKNIILNEESRIYILKYKNINEKKGEFIVEGELRNRCKGEWIINLTDEEIEKNIPEEDKLCKFQLQNIAIKIIKEFDKNNEYQDYEFLDFMKIALWVHKNIEYNLNFVGRDDLTAIDIYNLKLGVCSHFTRLSNALLYSLGYKVIYAHGYIAKDNEEVSNKNMNHAWSIININNKWFPFDSTWGIISGKLPVTHIFGNYFVKMNILKESDGSKIDKIKNEFKYIC